MRIGLLTNLSFQKYEASSTRDVIVKHVPNYLQVQNYDLVSHENIITVNGTLIGTSNANLALQCQQLISMHRQKRVVWIDASDQYANELDLCRITKLTGPTIDASKGPLVATFSLQAESLPPWGTTHTNPFNQSGILFRDLDGRLEGNAINPLDGNHNFTGSPAGGPFTSFSWEFIVDNQNPFTNVTSLQEVLGNSLSSPGNGVTFSSGLFGGGVTAFDSESIDSSTIPNSGYTGTMKATKASPAASTWYLVAYDMGSSGVNISAFDRLRLWFRSDQAGQASYNFGINDTSGNWRTWAFTLQAASTWQQLELALAAYSNQSGTAPSLTAIRYFWIAVKTTATPPASINTWLADIRAEIGYVTHCEDTWANGATVWNGTPTLSNDLKIFKNSYYGTGAQPLPSAASPETSVLSSLKASGISDATYGQMGSQFPLNALNATMDLTGYDFLVFWVRCDFAGASSGQLRADLGDNSGNRWEWTPGNFNANQWYRMVLPLREISNYAGVGGTYGTPNLNSISYFAFFYSGSKSVAVNIWYDEIALDVGKWVDLEFHVPDNISQNTVVGSTIESIRIYNWEGSSYGNGIGLYDPAGAQGSGPDWPRFLDGSSLNNVYATTDVARSGIFYAESPIATSASYDSALASATPASSLQALTYSTTYGCNSRLGIAMKMAPATSDSSTGNYPSDDIAQSAGMQTVQAISKSRFKVLLYISSEDTSYSGF